MHIYFTIYLIILLLKHKEYVFLCISTELKINKICGKQATSSKHHQQRKKNKNNSQTLKCNFLFIWYLQRIWFLI